ncbi:hypothetical protein [Mesorhizobium amorphae]|uniref:hypothetical protein n=1 Tax=Mesorhizobium amorphae TaxID=71433 RepID=UPI0021B1FC79|nr:hypothetical protein [Mesorhizobium amorphae]
MSGSNAPIPWAIRFAAMTSEMIAPELKTTIHHLPPVRNPYPSAMASPQSADGGWMPSPRKLSVAMEKKA